MKTLLIITVGQTDVQLVVDDQRHKLDGNTCGTLHDAIKVRSWSVDDAPIARSRDLIRELPDGEVKLCTPKLDAVLEYFKNTENTLPTSALTSALIFETTREHKRDPRLAGEVLERRLCNGGVTDVTRVSFLTGSEQLEDPSNDVDAVVRRTVVATISDAIGKQIKQLASGDKVIVATTGGLAAANELINEMARLLAVGGPKVSVLEVPDHERVQGEEGAVEEKFHPAAGFRARWHSLSLIEKGNLLGAWGAVRHLEGVPGQEWTEIVKWLAQFASSLPFDPQLPSDSDFDILRHTRMASRAALRVELALRAGDIPRAVHGTVAFFEAALWDGLNGRVERSTDPARRRYFRIKCGDVPTGDKLLRKGDESAEDRKRPFEFKETIDGINWYWIYDGDGGPAARLAKRFLKREGLVAFDKALGSDIRALRNDIAHNEPTSSLMAEAQTKMQEATLWSDENKFLTQPLVRNVLEELGVQQADQLCNSLIETVRKRLLTID